MKTSRRLLSLALLSAFALFAAPSAYGQPTISVIEDQATSPGFPTGQINFTVTDPETPSSGITVTAASSNQALVPDGNIVLGGSGANRTIWLFPAGVQRGQATITLTATDGSGQKGTRTFVLLVRIFDPLLNNTQRIDIRDAAVSSPGTSVPYPSMITSMIGLQGMAKTFPVELHEDLHKRLKIAAIEEGLTLHDLIVQTLEERVGGNGTGGSTSTKREGNNERSRNR